MDKSMERAHITIAMTINILGSGSKIKRMEMEFFTIKMEQSMMENGLMINRLIRDKLPTAIKINMKELS